MSCACFPFSSLTRPERCSTVTPGKFATFWCRPVSRLKSVDLPELGGPTTATTAWAELLGGSVAVAEPVAPQSWQSLISLSAISDRPRFRGAARIPSRPPGRRAGRRRGRSGRRQFARREEIRAPSVATPVLQADRGDRARHSRRVEGRKARQPHAGAHF